MYAVSFDLTVGDTEKHHPKGVSQAYTEIGAVLGEHGFRRVQGSLYVTDNEGLCAWLFLVWGQGVTGKVHHDYREGHFGLQRPSSLPVKLLKQ